jgi:hypothetical protein
VSDFETLLERLLLDPAFKTAMAADPERALTGYALADEERALLMAELSADAGQSLRMEERTSKAALFGVLGVLGDVLTTPTGGSPDSHPGSSAAPDGLRPWGHDVDPTHQGHKDGSIEVADYDHQAVSEHSFYHGLVSEIGMPDTDAESKDAPKMHLGDGEFAPSADFTPPHPDEFTVPTPNVKLPVDAAEFKPPTDPEASKPAAGDIKWAPQPDDSPSPPRVDSAPPRPEPPHK